MSSLLLRWLNDDIGLSPPVVNFENDFANGFLLGAIFAHFNQQPDFAAFVNDQRSDSKINNFLRLEPTFRRLDIAIDSRVAQQIMMRQKNSASKLVYQMKASLERIRAPTVGRGDGAVVKLVTVRDKAAKPGFEARSKEMFEKSIRRVAENQNDIYLREHMSKFGQGVEKLWEARDRAYQAKIDAHRAKLLEKRELEQQKLHRNHLASITTTERGIQEWRGNQERRLMQAHGAAEYRAREAAAKQQRAGTAREQAADEVASGIDEFEAIASGQGIEVKAGERAEDGTTAAEARGDFFERLAVAVGSDASQKELAAAQMDDIRRRRDGKRLAASVRERRRVVFLQCLERGQALSLSAAREDALVRELVRKPRVQLELEEQLQCVKQREAVFRDNRQRRSAAEDGATAAAVAREVRRQDELYRQMLQRFAADVQTALQTRDGARSNRSAVSRSRSVRACTEVLWKTIDAALVIAQQRELLAAELPRQVMRDIGVVFVSDLPMSAAVVWPPHGDEAVVAPDTERVGGDDDTGKLGEGDDGGAARRPVAAVVSTAGVDGDAQDAATPPSATAFFDRGAGELLDRTELVDMFERREAWCDPGAAAGAGSGAAGAGAGTGAAAAAAGEEAPDDASEELKAHRAKRPVVPALYDDEQLSFVVGEVVRSIADVAAPRPPPAVVTTPAFPVTAALIGPPFVGKAVQAQRLAAAHNLHAIVPEALVEEAVARASRAGADADAVDAAVAAALADGRPVPDDAVVALIVAAVYALQGSGVAGWLLVDFPQTVVQAQALETALTGFTASRSEDVSDEALWDGLLAPARPRVSDPNVVSWPHGVRVVLRVDVPDDRLARAALAPCARAGGGPQYTLDTTPPPLSLAGRGELVPQGASAVVVGEALEKHSVVADAVDSWFARGEHLHCVRGWRYDALEACTAAGADPALYAPLGAWSVPEYDALNEDELFQALSSTLSRAVATHAAADALRAQRSADFAARRAVVEAAAVATLAAGFSNATGRDNMPPPLPPVAAAADGDAAPAAADGGAVVDGADAEPDSKCAEDASDAPAAESPPAPTKEELGVLVPRVPATVADAVQLLFRSWRTAVVNYGSRAHHTLRSLRFEKAGVTWRCAVTRRRFAQFVRRPSPAKNDILCRFQDAFNGVDDDQRVVSFVQAELHLRVESAAQALWDVVDGREAAALREVEALRGDGWVQHSQQALAKRFAALMKIEMERFVATYHLLLDYFALADNGRVGVVAPLQVPSVDDEGKAGDAAQASAGGAAGGKDKAAPAAKGGGKPGAAAKGASKAAVAEPEPAAAEQASPLDASIAVASRHCSAGGDLVAAAVRGVATIRSWQEQQRSRLWDAELAAIAAEREARDAAAAAAAAGAAGKGAKPAAGKAAPAKAAAGKAPAGGKAGAKGKAGEPADAAPAVPDGATVFVNESVLAVVEHEARALEGRLQYLLRRCRSDCEHVSTLADAMLTSLAALASDTAAAEGAAVEALCAHARSAVEAATTLPARLQLEGPYLTVDASTPAVAPPAPEPARVVEAAHDLWLSPSQFSTLAHALRSASLGASGSLECGAAGYRLLPAAAFVDVVHRLSVAGKLPPLWARLPPSALWQLASDFGARDGGGSAGLVDWQAFCVSVSVTGGEGQGGVTPSGAAVGACIPRWMTASESKELEQAFAAKDDAASGFVPATSCADVAFWFESERQSAAVTVRAGAVHDSVGGACVRDVGAGWHNVAVDFATRDTWRAHEADRMAASASALVAHQQDQLDAAVVEQSNASVRAGWATVRRAIVNAFATTAQPPLFPYQRVCNYFRDVPRDVYDRLGRFASL